MREKLCKAEYTVATRRATHNSVCFLIVYETISLQHPAEEPIKNLKMYPFVVNPTSGESAAKTAAQVVGNHPIAKVAIYIVGHLIWVQIPNNLS